MQETNYCIYCMKTSTTGIVSADKTIEVKMPFAARRIFPSYSLHNIDTFPATGSAHNKTAIDRTSLNGIHNKHIMYINGYSKSLRTENKINLLSAISRKDISANVEPVTIIASGVVIFPTFATILLSVLFTEIWNTTANDKSYDATHDNLEGDTHQVSHQDSTPSAVILLLMLFRFSSQS